MEAAASTVLEHNFWEYLDQLVAVNRLVIDLPRGSHHPRFPDIIYPLDYGYLDGTTTVDGGGVDVWAGTLPQKSLTALVLTGDLQKRDKDRNMRARPQVALDIADPKNPYRYIQIRGQVVEIIREGADAHRAVFCTVAYRADAHIDALAGKYTGTPKYGNRRPDEERITCKIMPNKVTRTPAKRCSVPPLTVVMG